MTILSSPGEAFTITLSVPGQVAWALSYSEEPTYIVFTPQTYNPRCQQKAVNGVATLAGTTTMGNPTPGDMFRELQFVSAQNKNAIPNTVFVGKSDGAIFSPACLLQQNETLIFAIGASGFQVYDAQGAFKLAVLGAIAGPPGLQGPQGPMGTVNVLYAVPVVGFSIQIPSTTDAEIDYVLDPANGLFPGGTITMPQTPPVNQVVRISSSQSIAVLSVAPGAGQTIRGAPSSLAQNGFASFTWVAATLTWYRTA